MQRTLSTIRAVLAVFLGCVGVHSAPAETPLAAVQIASGISRPVYVTHAPNDFDRIFIVDQTGPIRIVKNGALLPTSFLDVNDISSCCSERGLLGLAFHPDYQENREFFINYTDDLGRSIVARFFASVSNPNIAEPVGEILLMIEDPAANHNGGWMEFGADGYLYIATGDGGSSYDPWNNAQNTDVLLGKILRIDVDGDDFPDDPDRNYGIPPFNPFVAVSGADEIWSYGLRNPWRCAFDRQTNDLYIADVGQGLWEEINVQPASSNGGENYGWRCMEGDHCTNQPECDCPASPAVTPVHEYEHGGTNFRCAIIGGEVYRGCAIPDLRGTYFFADHCSMQIWSLRYQNGIVTGLTERTNELDTPGILNISSISSFGRDAYGELYICDLDARRVFKIVAAAEPVDDCNENSRQDSCDILDGTSADANHDGVPDECAPLTLIASSPPTGAIDARQPSGLDGSNPSGWSSIELTFSRSAASVGTDDFAMTQVGGTGSPPTISNAQLIGPTTLKLVLNKPISAGAWTHIVHIGSGSAVRLGYLPGDVNGDGVSSALDILGLIDSLNGIVPRPLFSTDADRSGGNGAPDILRLIDLLNGAGVFPPYLGVRLP